jgi:hypothetical protein
MGSTYRCLPSGLGEYPHISQLWPEGQGHVALTWWFKPLSLGALPRNRRQALKLLLTCTPFNSQIVFLSCPRVRAMQVVLSASPQLCLAQAWGPSLTDTVLLTSGIDLPSVGSTSSALCLPVGGVWKLVWQPCITSIHVSAMLVSSLPPPLAKSSWWCLCLVLGMYPGSNTGLRLFLWAYLPSTFRSSPLPRAPTTSWYSALI